MTKYVKTHTKYILEQINANNITNDLLSYHRLQISNIQHERLIHLIVMCLFTFLLVCSVVLFFLMISFLTLSLLAIILIVDVFYILHYYLLENTVQTWYKLENDMISTLQNIGSNLSKE